MENILFYIFLFLNIIAYSYMLIYKIYSKTDKYKINQIKNIDIEIIRILLDISYEKHKELIDNWCKYNEMQIVNGEIIKI